MNSPSNQSITESFDEQKCDSKENIDGDEYPILWYNLEKSLEEKFDKIHSFSQVEEMYKFAKSLNVNFMMIIPRDYDEEGLSRDFSEFKDIHIERLLKTEEEMILKHFGQETSDPSFKVCLFYTLEDFERESPIDPNEYEVTMMKDIKEMAKEFREEFAILWYDCNLGCEMKEKVVNKLDIEEKNIYKNFEELLERMNKPNELPYHLILTGKKYDELKEIIDRDLLLGLYVYGSDDNKFASAKSPKIRVENTLEDLTPKIQEGIRTNSKIKSDLPAFTTDFDTEDRSKIYNLHNNLQGLINFRNRKQAKADFLNLIKKMYPRSQKITDFEQEYNDYDKGKILFWYTKDSPIYRVLNNSLRIATADSILCCRFMLKDLERAIREEYQLKNRDFSGAVYRGAFVSASEWEKLQRNVGKEIEMYGFLSTSADKKAATNFLANAPQDKIFITIIIPPLPELDSQGFANVSEFSEFKKENEILFNVRSRFKILQAQDPARKNGYRHLVLLFGSKLLRRNMTQEKPEISLDLAFCAQDCEGCGKRENLFGYKQEKTQVRCLECLQQDSIVEDVPLLSLSFQGSEKVLEGRISNFKSKVGFENSGYQCADCGDIGKKRYYRWINIEEKSDIKQCDGCFKSKKGEIKGESSPFVFWQEEQEEWEKIESKHKEENQESLQFLNEGEVYLQLRDYKKALGYGKRVLEELLFKRFKEIEKLRAYNLIAYCLQGLGNNKEALLYWTKRLEITRFRKGEMNPQTALEFMRLASCHESMSHFQEAVDFGMKSLEIMKLYYGENHPEIGNSYDQIAIALMHLGKYQEAVEFSLKALDIWKSIYGEKHRKTAGCYNILSLIYGKMAEHQKH